MQLRSLSARVIRLSRVTRYAIAVAAAIGAILARLALDPLWRTGVPYITFFPAIMLSAWLGGLWPGLVTTVLTAAAAEYFWLEPARSWTVANPSELIGLAVFLMVGLVISALNESWRVLASGAERRANELEHHHALTETAMSHLDSDGLTRELLDRVRAMLHCDTATMLLVDPTGSHLTAAASRGLEDAVDSNVRIPVGRGIAGRIAASSEPLVVDDIAGAEIVNPILRARLKSLVGVPLKVGDRLLGVLHAGSATARHFTDGDVALLSLAADRIASAIERARLLTSERASRQDAENASKQLQVALEAGQMGTWEYTIRTGAVKWSPGLEAIHGHSPGAFPGTFDAFREEIHPDDRDRVVQDVGDAVAQRRDHHIEYRIVRTDGSVRWVEGRGRLFVDASGQPDRMVGVCADITDRKQADERFRLAVEAAPAAMLLVDTQGVIVMVNAMSEQLLGYARGELVGQSIDRLVPSRVRQRHAAYRTTFAADAQPRPMGAGRELNAVRNDGSEVPVEIGLSPFETADGLFVLAAVTDISLRKHIEDERAQLLTREQTARAEVERANRLKDEFLAVLSHELRTPLNAVLGYAHLLGAGALSPERTAHAIAAIRRNAQAQARMVESLLDLSRVMAGKLELDLERLDVAKLVESAIDVVRPDADTREIALDAVVPAGLPSLIGDGGRLQQALGNLLSNAIKFTPQGGRVGIHVTAEDAAIAIRVADNGQGISAEFLPYVFDRFKQAEGKGRSPTGLGLGLALVREMVQAHGGTVVAESAGEGRGSTFTVTLPLSAAAGVEHSSGTTATAAAPASLAPLDVLIVDDDGDVRDLLGILLESRGAAVRAASSAAAALDAIGQRRPDVLLADVGMPDEDGYSFIRKVRARECNHNGGRLPAIAVTAYANVTDRERALAAGYDSHVAKPVDPEALARAIVKVAKPGHL